MDDAGHKEDHHQPSTELGRAIKDLVSAAPQFVATIKSADDHHHKDGHDKDEDGVLDPLLLKLIQEIRDGLKEMRNPAGVVANCRDALTRLISAFKQVSGSPSHGHGHAGERPHNHFVGAILLALVVIAGAFLLFGAHTDVVFGPETDPEYRQLAYAGAVDAPNLGTWMAWAVLLLGLVGAAVWTMGRMAPSSPPVEGEQVELRALYEKGAISRDLYDRGRWLSPDDTLRRPTPSVAYAREFAAYILALADTLRHRRKLESAAQMRDSRPLEGILGGSIFGPRPPAKVDGH